MTRADEAKSRTLESGDIRARLNFLVALGCGLLESGRPVVKHAGPSRQVARSWVWIRFRCTASASFYEWKQKEPASRPPRPLKLQTRWT